jgi:hypothetical protein
MAVDFEAIWARYIAALSTQNRPRNRRATPIVTLPIVVHMAEYAAHVDAMSLFSNVLAVGTYGLSMTA